MNPNELITKQDLLKAEERIIAAILEKLSAYLTPTQQREEEYLRTKAVRKLLSVCENKLQDMRLKREIPFTYIGATYYYPKGEILDLLEANMVQRDPNV